jgi:hypothetical protein
MNNNEKLTIIIGITTGLIVAIVGYEIMYFFGNIHMIANIMGWCIFSAGFFTTFLFTISIIKYYLFDHHTI